MSYQATVFNVLIASPGDVEAERKIVREVIHEWNETHSRSRKIVLQPMSWETHSHPSMGDRPQAVINKQIVDSADLLVAIFWSRIGTPTGQAVGGSVEELERHMKAGKPAMVYFSNAGIPRNMIAPDQHKALNEFRDWCQPRGLYQDYESLEDFKEKFRRHLANKINHEKYFQPQQDRQSVTPIVASPVRKSQELSPDARTLLLEAAEDKGGHIIARKLVSTGFQVSTHNTQFVEAGNPRSQARWRSVLNELEKGRFIELTRTDGLYQVTQAGYELADTLRQ